MDPELLRQILAEATRGQQKGASDNVIGQWVSENTNGQYRSIADLEKATGWTAYKNRSPLDYWKTAIQGLPGIAAVAAHGASLGTLDEILGSIVSGQDPWDKDRSKYLAARDAIRKTVDDTKKKLGFAGEAIDLAGGLLMPLGFAGDAAKVPSFFRALGRGAMTGAAVGGLAGLGYAPEMKDIPLRMGTGAVGGGVVGGLLGGGTDVLAGLARGTTGRALMGKIEESGGEAALRQKYGEFVGTGRGNVATLADLSPQLQEAGDWAATQSGVTRARYKPAMDARHQAQPERMLQDLTELVGGKPVAATRREGLEQARRTIANDPTTGYEAVLSKAKGWYADPRVTEVLQRPIIREQLSGMLRLQEAAGEQPRITGQMMQAIRAVLREKAKTAGKTFTGHELGKAADDLDKILRDVPGFPEIQQAFAKASAPINAMDKAAKVVAQTDAEDLRAYVAKLDPTALEAFRLALASKLRQELNLGLSGTRKHVFGVKSDKAYASEDLTEKGRIIFGNSLPEWMRRLSLERTMETTRGAFGGSATAGREAAAKTIGPEQVGEFAVRSFGVNPLWASTSIAGRMIPAEARRRGAQRMGPLLFEQGRSLDDLLQEIATMAARESAGWGSTVLAPTVAGLLLGRHH